MAVVLDILNEQLKEEMTRCEFMHLLIGDIFRVNDHDFIKIKESSINCSRLNKSESNTIDLNTGHYCNFSGGTPCKLIKTIYPERLHKRLTMSEIYKLPKDGKNMYNFLHAELNRLCRRLPQYTETEIMLALLRYYT